MPGPAVAVMGAGGSQAGSLLQGLARAREMGDVVAVDRAWTPGRRASAEALGCQIVEADMLTDRSRLADELAGVQLVVNMAGPFYVLGTAALELALLLKADYLDICDDIDATEALLAREDDIGATGICAVIGLGSSPGMTNILIRMALDALGGGAGVSVDISWVVDAEDMTIPVFDHMLHCFATALPGGTKTAGWTELDPELVEFPDPVGAREVVRLGHPEVVTIPRFTEVERVTNKGGVAPAEYLHTTWALARATDAGTPLPAVHQQYAGFDAAMRQTGRIRGGSGLIVDVHRDGTGYRFASGADTSMADSTGIPAAAGVLMMLEGSVPGPGAWAPECLSPAAFFAKLREVSTGGGGLHLLELADGRPGKRVRIRDLLAGASAT
ncbi:MAG: saccharopine dehydrogenase L-lysine forming [Baekduia sp.]|jgi:saccharopine dehydrogenase (NAD+, L-lysine-forming)|nr:saccharopine dehydrogenase L-lysine forming [Baekduia sp.]